MKSEKMRVMRCVCVGERGKERERERERGKTVHGIAHKRDQDSDWDNIKLKMNAENRRTKLLEGFSCLPKTRKLNAWKNEGKMKFVVKSKR